MKKSGDLRCNLNDVRHSGPRQVYKNDGRGPLEEIMRREMGLLSGRDRIANGPKVRIKGRFVVVCEQK